MRLDTFITTAAVIACSLTSAAPLPPPPQDLVEKLHLSPFYQKHLDIEGFPILASAKVSDYALLEASYLLRKTIGHRPDILRTMAADGVRLVIMAPTEMTTDVPEHSDMKPAGYWDRRARGLGCTKERPAVSCGEENLLCLIGDPYVKENILIHEFGHAIHEAGLNKLDPTFNGRLQDAYDAAMKAGLWKGTYSTTNRMEYWAEAVQCWFDCAGSHDREHGDIDTRDKIKVYDPALSKLLAEVYGDTPWRYQKPAQRNADERAHLAGFDVTTAPHFAWPQRVRDPASQGTLLTWIAPDKTPATSPRSGSSKKATVLFVNHRAKDVSLDWLDFDGKRKHYATVRPGISDLQSTFAGHVWLISEGADLLGSVVAIEEAGRAEIK